jgi:predicted solute-binding protein
LRINKTPRKYTALQYYTKAPPLSNTFLKKNKKIAVANLRASRKMKTGKESLAAIFLVMSLVLYKKKKGCIVTQLGIHALRPILAFCRRYFIVAL